MEGRKENGCNISLDLPERGDEPDDADDDGGDVGRVRDRRSRLTLALAEVCCVPVCQSHGESLSVENCSEYLDHVAPYYSGPAELLYNTGKVHFMVCVQ